METFKIKRTSGSTYTSVFPCAVFRVYPVKRLGKKRDSIVVFQSSCFFLSINEPLRRNFGAGMRENKFNDFGLGFAGDATQAVRKKNHFRENRMDFAKFVHWACHVSWNRSSPRNFVP